MVLSNFINPSASSAADILFPSQTEYRAAAAYVSRSSQVAAYGKSNLTRSLSYLRSGDLIFTATASFSNIHAVVTSTFSPCTVKLLESTPVYRSSS